MLKGCPTPLKWREWDEGLREHPDNTFASYVVSGIREGFRIGFDYQSHRYKSAKRNMISATDHANVVRDYLAKECAEGRILGPFDPQYLPHVQVSPFGVIEKKERGKWRLILDLSSPEGFSVNDGISPDLCSLSYISVDDVAKIIAQLGPGTQLAKVDIKSAYRMVPIHPDDRHLLGMKWEEALYVDAALPFGLRSAPKIFTAVADALEWMVKKEGVTHLHHYLDDFLILGAPDSEECAESLRKLLVLFEGLKVPIAIEKLEGPTPVLVFLGIELDTTTLAIRLPEAKLKELKVLILEWLGRKHCSRRELQSIAGKLQNACKVVRPGRVFLRRVFNLLKGTPARRQVIRLNASFRSDIQWWHCFLDRWNGVAMMSDASARPVDIHLFTDASGSFGCGAWWGTAWLQYPWADEAANLSIAVKELLPIVMACMLWGNTWRNKQVLVHCDNQAVVEVVNSGASKDQNLAQLLRCLFFITAEFQLALKATHITGHSNVQADAISRNNLSLFFSQVPNATRSPSPVPSAIVELLITRKPDWTSPVWSQLFTSCLRPV